MNENQQKRAKISEFLNGQRLANLNNESTLQGHKEFYIMNRDQNETFAANQGPIGIKDLYLLNNHIQDDGHGKNDSKLPKYALNFQQEEKYHIFNGYYIQKRTKGNETTRPLTKQASEKGVSNMLDAEKIQELFPDRAIKAQKFIDLLSSNRNYQQSN